MMKETLNTKGGGLLLVSIPQIMITLVSMIKSGFILKTLFVLSFLLFLSRFSLAWGPDVRLTYDDSMSFMRFTNGFKVAVDTNGKIYVVWEDTRHRNNDDNWEIYYKRWNGIQWEPDTRLTVDTVPSITPSVASDRFGKVHVVYNSYYYDICYRKWNGTVWEPLVLLNPPPRLGGADPSIATDTFGRVHVVWSGIWRGAEIMYRMWNGATWDTVTRLTNDTINQDSPSIATDLSGNVHLVWRDYRDSRNPEIYYKRRVGTVWGPDTRLTYDTAYSGDPAVATDTSGNVHVVWNDSRLGRPQIYYKRWNGSQWEPDLRLSTSSSSEWEPSIAVDDSGRVHVVWTDAIFQIYYRRWNGSVWDPVETIANVNSPKAYPCIAADHWGGLHVVWCDQRDGNWEIYYKRGGLLGLPRREPPGERKEADHLRVSPNPFRTSVSFVYYLRQPAQVQLKIYNLTGSLVKVISIGSQIQGRYQVPWDGKDASGADAPVGFYFVSLVGQGINDRARFVKVK